MNFLHFEHLPVDDPCDEKVLITVEMNSQARDCSLNIVRGLVKKEVEKVNIDNFSNSNYGQGDGVVRDDYFDNSEW